MLQYDNVDMLVQHQQRFAAIRENCAVVRRQHRNTFADFSTAQAMDCRFVCLSKPSKSSIIYHHVLRKASVCNSLKLHGLHTCRMSFHRWIFMFKKRIAYFDLCKISAMWLCALPETQHSHVNRTKCCYWICVAILTVNDEANVHGIKKLFIRYDIWLHSKVIAMSSSRFALLRPEF